MNADINWTKIMRKYIKKRILKSIVELVCIHRQIEQYFQKGCYEEMQDMLIQCQKGAIWIGSTLDEEEQIDKSVIKKLEDYCEAVYKLFVKSNGYTKRMLHSEAKNIIKPIREQLDNYMSDVKTYTEKKISVKTEVVFLPYKVSMWDSLESVWMAARDDPDCNALVIPIPYFNKNPDGTISKMYYEGGDFPEYVPVVSWEEYDLKNRHPDIIFIHNPYDNVNYVTTIHPDFYCQRIKDYTDRLVYIPYFVCENDTVGEEFCVLPGTLYSDRVIVQSENVRQMYIQEFHKFERDNQCEGQFGNAEEKFQALGSPKYDKVLQTTRENIEIPAEWLAKIVKQDGSWRKVLLYNTSVNQLLMGEEQLLLKLESVFGQLRNRDDIVLLWRPHPLSEAACVSLRPELLEQYYKIVEEYKKKNWGIYDDTPDVHRAIALSDAYYGDHSSLVEMYKITGKPIMLQNVNIV